MSGSRPDASTARRRQTAACGCRKSSSRRASGSRPARRSASARAACRGVELEVWGKLLTDVELVSQHLCRAAGGPGVDMRTSGAAGGPGVDMRTSGAAGGPALM
eukprot:213480-Chlamydomonas_euryale.AAC.1